MELLIAAALLIFAWLVASAGGAGRSAKSIGLRGERKVDRLLRRKLERGTYWVFHDLTLPIGRETTQIDHVVVSRFGVFVIETKNYGGWIFGDEKQRNWTHVFFRKKFRFMNPLLQNYKHTKAVSDFLCCSRDQVLSVVVFAGRGQFRTEMPYNVVYRKQLVPYIRAYRKAVIDQNKVLEFADRLLDRKDSSLPAIRSGAQSEVVDLRHGCPRCGSKLVERVSRRPGSQGGAFLGCSNYPRCRFTKSLE